MNKLKDYMELCQTVKCTLRPSPIHGVGVFAMRDIKKGERLFCLPTTVPEWYGMSFKDLDIFDKTHPEIKELILGRWPAVANGSKFLSPNYDARMISFMNHSDIPNYDIATDSAARDIKVGEEVTEDYRTMPNYQKMFPFLDAQEASK